MTANRPLNKQALALEEAEARIRIAVKNEYFKSTPRERLNVIINNIITEALKSVTIPALRIAAARSLVNFYNRQYIEIKRLVPNDELLFLMAGERNAVRRVSELKPASGEVANVYGVPNGRFPKEYIDREVRPVLDRLAKQFPLDPDDVSGRNSLRNRAEMEVRYQGHADNISELKSAGHKLVIASVHADCSERCAGWQGRVYSLDGTSGVTDDGRKYVPLEQATDVWYTTKAGKRYKNGLLGFNCRHYLVPYKSGFKFPKPSAKEERREYAITLRQRALERNVLKWRTQALTNKGIDAARYKVAKKKAETWNKEYIRYSQTNGRAYYPSRTKLI